MDLTFVNQFLAAGENAIAPGLARELVEKSQRVFVVGPDPNFGATVALGLGVKTADYDFLFKNVVLKVCIPLVRKNLAIRNSGPVALIVEECLRRNHSLNLVFEHALQETTGDKRASNVSDAGSGLSGLQATVVCYSKRILALVTTNALCLMGARSSIISTKVLRPRCSPEVEPQCLFPIMT
jgi:hypothetical protein